MSGDKIDLDKPRYDQSTYWGRARHFISVTNPLNLLASERELDQAAAAVNSYKKTGIMPRYYDEERLWKAKSLYDSAFHPDTGEKMIIFGRMSAQMPANTIITAGMITFYKTTRATVFWQWINQSFNATVNYTNRSGTKPMPTSRLVGSYLAATGSALGTALYLNSLTKSMSPMWGKLVPFVAVCAANCINIPCMRSSEIIDGLAVFTEDNKYIADSRKAAITAISLVVLSRILMATPGMILTPYITEKMESKGVFLQRPRAKLPVQVALVALCVTFATPMCCALFEQRSSLNVCDVEPEVREKALKIDSKIQKVYFNKGL